jgi:hypothetical protein
MACQVGPPSRLRRCGAASFAGQELARFTEPKLAAGERRMVDLTGLSWNRIVPWLRRLDAVRPAS